MFTSLFLLALPGLVGQSGGQTSASYQVDSRGIVVQVDVGGARFLTGASVSLVAPGWRGSLGDQRALEAKAVEKGGDAGETVYQCVLTDKKNRTKLREVVRPIAGGVRLEYEFTPETEIQVEAVLFRGEIPMEPHRASTRYVANSGDEILAAEFPRELPKQYHFLPGRPYEWLALVSAGGAALRLKAEGMSLGMQDTRKFGGSTYELMGIAPARGTLAAGKPIRFAIELTGSTADEVAREQTLAMAQTFSGFPLSSRAALKAGEVRVDRAKVGVYERVELTAGVSATFDNPFDPDDVALDAQIDGPDGRRLTVPGFFDVPCRMESGEQERVRPAGPGGWRFRFTPSVPGRYRAVVRVRDRSGQATCPPVHFEAVASKRPGFVRVAKASPLYFQFDDGRSYFPVGENVCWAHTPKPIADYTAWFRGLASAGANWARLWLANNEKGLEWSPQPTPKGGRGHYLGLGRYAIDNCWRLDQIVRLAEENGIQLMFCIGTFGEIKSEDDYFGANLWVSNPYNAANGGPCAKPQDFFTNPTARKLYQRRLRYILARWGYSPNVFAWEFWNEYRAPAAWVQEMAAFLKQHDPNRHLVSTTYGDDAVWKLSDVDFTMTHHYGDRGSVTDFGDLFQRHTLLQRAYGKPFFIAEFGIDWRTSDARYDPEGKGQNLHNGLWAGVMAGGAGTPMLWYWDHYVHVKNLYQVFRPVARFVEGIDWARNRFEPITGLALAHETSAPEQFSEMEFTTEGAWGKTAAARHVFHRDGRIDGGPIAGNLGGPHKRELPHEVSFQLDMPVAGEFSARLGTVSSRARLQIRVDDRLEVDEPLKTGPPGQGPWKASTYYPQWKIWQSDYDRDYSVKLPAGKHVVTIANLDGDWLSLRGGRVSAYRSSRYPFVRALGVRSESQMLVWIQDKKSTWKAVLDKIAPQETTGLRLTVPGVADGEYQVEWWNTYSGEVLQRSKVRVAGGRLALPVPNFTRDVAAVIRR